VAPSECISALRGWEGFEVCEWRQERRGIQIWCVLRLRRDRTAAAYCSGCWRAAPAIHDVEWRTVRDLPLFEHAVELEASLKCTGVCRCRERGSGGGSGVHNKAARLEYVEVEQEKAREQSVLPSAPQRVLVADDNSDLAESVAMLLRFEGHEVRIAHDGLSALELAEEFKPDAALLDIGLPGLNGYELARKLRSHSSGQKLLLIAVTGYGRFEDRARSKNAGFDCHLVKPVDPHALSALLKKRHTD
jgi:two-component system OmpR family response regulator